MFFVGALALLPSIEHLRIASHERVVGILEGYRINGIAWQQIPRLFFPHLERADWAYATRLEPVALALALLSFVAGIGAQVLSQKEMLSILLSLLIFTEVMTASYGLNKDLEFPKVTTFRYEEELEDFRHLKAVSSYGSPSPSRIECRGPVYKLLCPDYAVIHSRLRLVNGEPYLFPTSRVQTLVQEPSHLQLLDVRYILSPFEIHQPGYRLHSTLDWKNFEEHEEAGLQIALDNYTSDTKWDGSVYIYEAEQSVHAFWVEEGFTGDKLPQNLEIFHVTHFTPLHIELEGKSNKPGLVFVSELYYPGWYAQVDGVGVDIQDIAGGYMGVPVESGNHGIVLNYSPLSFRIGFRLTLVSILILILFAFYRSKRQPV